MYVNLRIITVAHCSYQGSCRNRPHVPIAVTGRCAPRVHHRSVRGTSCSFLRPWPGRALHPHRHFGFLCCARSSASREGFEWNNPPRLVGEWFYLDGPRDLVDALCGHASLQATNSCPLRRTDRFTFPIGRNPRFSCCSSC